MNNSTIFPITSHESPFTGFSPASPSLFLMYNTPMNLPATRFLLFLLVTFHLLLSIDCASTYAPSPPLWDSSFYDTIAVLPVRMTVSTGRPPFTSEDTELSDNMGGMMQEALSIVVRYKGYEVLSPNDLSERLMDEEDLAEAFISLAESQGLMGPDRTAAYDEGMEGAALIGEKLGADLLVLAYGHGEYHSAGEELVQTIITGLLTKGKEQYQAPPSFLEANILFVDPVTGSRIARFPGRRMEYEKEIIPLSRRLDRVLRRVPVKRNAERSTQDAGEVPQP